MTALVHADPRNVVTWDDFTKTAPANSIALDGYVMGPPAFQEEGPFANFNHHEDVVRLATRCTAMQVLMGLKQGLFDVFNREETLHLWVNDCDHDVCLSVWLLQNADRVLGTKSEPLISRLCFVVDMLDTCAGAFPIEPTSRSMEEVCWIFDPYVSARVAGRIPSLSADETIFIIEAVCARISSYTIGMGQRKKLDTRFEVLREGYGWKMVREIGNDARTAMRVNGAKAFVSLRNSDGGAFHYSVGKMTPYAHFPLPQIYAGLNEAEEITSATECWGGSDTIGGSPRSSGSKLSPLQVYEIIETILANRPAAQLA